MTQKMKDIRALFASANTKAGGQSGAGKPSTTTNDKAKDCDNRVADPQGSSRDVDRAGGADQARAEQVRVFCLVSGLPRAPHCVYTRLL